MPKFRMAVLTLLIAALLSGGLPANALAPLSRTQSLTTQTLEILQLAQYMPASTTLFGAVRIDDEHLQILDTLIERVVRRFPNVNVPERPLRSALEQTLRIGGFDWAQDIRPWLGKHAAIGIGSLESMILGSRMGGSSPEFVIAVEITDRAKAEAFVDRVLAIAREPQFEKRTQGAFTLYVGNQFVSGDLLLGDSVLLIATKGSLNAALGRGDKLSDSKTFGATLNKLPAPSYNVLAYFDLSSIMSMLRSELGRFGGNMPPIQLALLSAVGPIAIGGTILEDRTFSLDTVQYLYPEGLASAGYTYPYSKPVNPAFVNYFPAGTSALIHQSDFKGLVDMVISLSRLSEAAQDSAFDARWERSKEEFKTLTGLDLEADVLSWMTGDYGFFLSYNPDAPNPLISMSLNEPFSLDAFGGGLVIEATDPTKAKNVAEKLGAAIIANSEGKVPNLEVRQEAVAGVPSTVLSVKDERLSSPFEIVIGANDKVFVIATRAAAEAIFSGAPGLDTTDAYKDATGFFLNAPTQVWYLSPSGFDLIGLLISVGLVRQAGPMTFSTPVIASVGSTPAPTATPDPDAAEKRRLEMIRSFEEGLKVIKGITSLFAHAAITGYYNEDGSTVGRSSITLTQPQ